MTSLRQRMLEDMQVRRLSACTQRTYVETVARFARWCPANQLFPLPRGRLSATLPEPMRSTADTNLRWNGLSSVSGIAHLALTRGGAVRALRSVWFHICQR